MNRAPTITAQIANGAEAYVALRRDRRERGPNGEASLAEIWRTTDSGRTWHSVPWRRAARVFVSRALFARWPPEWVNRIWLGDGNLVIEVREDWGTIGKGEPIWCAEWIGNRWRVRFDRVY